MDGKNYFGNDEGLVRVPFAEKETIEQLIILEDCTDPGMIIISSIYV